MTDIVNMGQPRASPIQRGRRQRQRNSQKSLMTTSPSLNSSLSSMESRRSIFSYTSPLQVTTKKEAKTTTMTTKKLVMEVKKKKKSVRFNENCRVRIVRKVCKDEYSKVWYSKDDYTSFEAEQDTVKTFISALGNELSLEKTDYMSTLGIEHLINPRQYIDDLENRHRSWEAVFEEQWEQWESHAGTVRSTTTISSNNDDGAVGAAAAAAAPVRCSPSRRSRNRKAVVVQFQSLLDPKAIAFRYAMHTKKSLEMAQQRAASLTQNLQQQQQPQEETNELEKEQEDADDGDRDKTPVRSEPSSSLVSVPLSSSSPHDPEELALDIVDAVKRRNDRCQSSFTTRRNKEQQKQRRRRPSLSSKKRRNSSGSKKNPP